MTYVYRLTDEKGESHRVCKKFFLATLGHKESSNVVSTAKASATDINAKPDQRGKKKSDVNTVHEKVDSHIRSYNPSISHYRREHAPNRLYLPYELSVIDMHSDFNEQHPEQKVHYTTYLRRVQAMNISFAQLGQEQCEQCSRYDHGLHDLRDGKCSETCGVCAEKVNHLQLAKEAHDEYKTDGMLAVDNNAVRSVDLQKVIMLPRLPGFKSACFTRRLVTFHHTFAPIGSYTTSCKTLSVAWHEAVSGRKCEDIASSFRMALENDRSKEDVVYFMDNCAGQNKNYTLFTAMLSAINGPTIDTKTITFKYLEVGHTFMSADSCHALIEKKMKKKVNVMDFPDFIDCLEQANCKVVSPSFENFKLYEGQQSAAKLKSADRPKLADIRVVQFRRGEKTVFYKTRHTDSEFKQFDYLKQRHSLAEPGSKASARGVSVKKKEDILKSLIVFMPTSRQQFWKELPTGNVADLIDNE